MTWNSKYTHLIYLYGGIHTNGALKRKRILAPQNSQTKVLTERRMEEGNRDTDRQEENMQLSIRNTWV